MKTLCMLLVALLMFSLAACTPGGGEELPPRSPVDTPGGNGGSDNPGGGPGGDEPPPGSGNGDINGEENDPPSESRAIRLVVGSEIFAAELADTPAAEAFRTLLPMSIRMSDLNANEKFYYLPDDLPSSATSPETVRTGDIMLFGRNCLVVFYKTFATSYSYTWIGTVGNAGRLEDALGTGDVDVIFDCLDE